MRGVNWTTVDEGEHWKIRREERGMEEEREKERENTYGELHMIRRLPHRSLL